jgi:hypothetical protein
MEQRERLDLERRLYKAKVTFGRYKQYVIANPERKDQLAPILQGCRELIWDLEKELQHLEVEQATVERIRTQ